MLWVYHVRFVGGANGLPDHRLAPPLFARIRSISLELAFSYSFNERDIGFTEETRRLCARSYPTPVVLLANILQRRLLNRLSKPIADLRDARWPLKVALPKRVPARGVEGLKIFHSCRNRPGRRVFTVRTCRIHD